MTLTPAEIAAELAAAGVEPSRALGQNFVADPNTVRRIARLAAVGPGDRVLEIGAGLGSLTLALAETGAEVTAVEVDARLLPGLRARVEPAGVAVVAGDATTLDWAEVLGDVAPWTLVANLPYNIATPLVLDVLATAPAVHRLLVMVQREVAERLAAAPGSKAYGIPSVKVAYAGAARVVGTVPATVFVPRPRVESALVEIVRRPPPAEVDRARLFTLVEAGFGQRRKTLRNSLAGLVDAAGFAAAHVDAAARAEQLDLDAWCRLARAAT